MVLLLAMAPMVLLLAESIAMTLCRKKGISTKLRTAVLTYLGVVTPFTAVEFAGTDEFGYGAIPALVISVPWYFLLAKPLEFVNGHLLATIFLGALVNCAILYVTAYTMRYVTRYKEVLPRSIAAEESTHNS